ncbi:MAG: hypothetical protein HXY41_13600 [Chloroflexi bacterium]|nr:hypothetical protein [Chloroflexota bacterium]
MQPTPDQLPDYHFLLVAPNLGAEWLFDAARAYWERFRPLVVSNLDLIQLLPPENSIIVTAIARRDTVADLGVRAAQVLPHALFDPVVYDLFDDMKNALITRATLNQPFGVPLIPTPTAPEPITPTPGAIISNATPPPTAAPPTRQPAGFITATPPDAPPPTDTPSGPVYPTPGPIVGGSS